MHSSRLNLIFPLIAAVFHANGVLAAGPDVCAALPLATVNELTHRNLTGVRSDVSEEAQSYGCAYAATVAGLGDKAVYDKGLGTIALFGDTVIDAFVPQGNLTDAQLSAIEKSLILALRNKL